jgi:Fur family ferric uptake transcriptional regulator
LRAAIVLLKQACRETGLYMGRQRRAVIDVLANAEDHPTAEEIFFRARQKDQRLSISTVYRNLSILEQHGLVRRYDFGDRATRYEDATRGRHEHLVNTESGEVANFANTRVEAFLKEVAAEMGYTLEGYQLTLQGKPVRAPSKN